MKVVSAIMLSVALCVFVPLAAQNKRSNSKDILLPAPPLSQRITNSFHRFAQLKEEKVYLHIDKPYYAASDKIWFKAYLVNAMLHTLSNVFSNFIFVELYNAQDSLVERLKIKRDEDGFVGSFALPPNIPEGQYYLRAYSHYMKNNEDYLHSRPFRIGNAIIDGISHYAHYEKNEKAALTATYTFLKEDKTPLTGVKIKSTVYGTKQKPSSRTTTINSYGTIFLQIPAYSSINNKLYVDLEVISDRIDYRTTVMVPYIDKDFSLSFFPEGGHILAGNNQLIAFKAQAADGYSKAVSGYILNQGNDTIAHFSTKHNGMGRFSLIAEPADKFTAVATSVDGLTKRFPLPAVQSKGIQLGLSQVGDKVYYQINSTPETPMPDSLFMVLHTRGMLQALLRVPGQEGNGAFITENLEEGAYHLLLINPAGHILSERLFYVRRPASYQWTVNPLQNNEVKREKIVVDISLLKDEMPVSGSFSVSVTDNRTVNIDETADNIISNLLLTSELKGYIEAPGYYFNENTPAINQALDLLMLTHGWRRYPFNFTAENYTATPKAPQHFAEVGQSISGQIKGLLFTSGKNANVIVTAPKINFFHYTQADNNGQFVLDGVQFEDSTTFIIQAYSKGGKDVQLAIDPETYPMARHNFPEIIDTLSSAQMDSYLFNTREQYLSEGGELVYHIKELVFTAAAAHPEYTMYGAIITGSGFNAGDIAKMPGSSAFDIIRRMPGILSTGSSVHIFGAKGPPLIVVNGEKYNDFGSELAFSSNNIEEVEAEITYDDESFSILSGIDKSDIYSIEIIRPLQGISDAAVVNRGAIVINLKQGAGVRVKASLGLAVVMPKGYNRCAEFYAPVYDTPQSINNNKTDRRSTLYWNPRVKPDEHGCIWIEFYNNDQPGGRHLIIEGITDDGTPCRYSGEL